MKKASLTTSDKVILLLSLVPYLKENGPTPIETVARDFDVTVKQVDQLARFLGQSGIPGPSGTYLHNYLFDINWSALENDGIIELVSIIAVDDTPRLSATEAAAIAAGLQLLKHLVPDLEQGAVSSLEAKLATASTGMHESISGISEAAPGPRLDLIFKAIRNSVSISFQYLSKNKESTNRTVDPYELIQYGDFWYLEGYCHLREGIRLFRVESITELSATEEIFDVREEWLERKGAKALEGVTVRVLVAEEHAAKLRDWSPTVTNKKVSGKVELEIILTSDTRVIPLVASIPGAIEVIDPPHLREAVAGWAADLVGVLGNE